MGTRKIKRSKVFIGTDPRSNYVSKLTSLKLDPGVHNVQIYHDHWCQILNGGTVCNCNPDVEVKKTN